MLADALLEQLRYKVEGSDLDYKAERYRFAKASDDDKSELLKDILALANATRDGEAYVLIGFKESPPNPAEVVGLPAEGAIDDSRIQEFINGKLETKLSFRYEEGVFEGKHIAVISIPKQQRPFYLKKNYGPLTKDTVYVRRGSATGIASPREIAMMGASNAIRGEPQVELLFQTPTNEPMQQLFEREFVYFTEELPDYQPNRGGYFAVPSLTGNRNYWRDAARFLSTSKRVIHARLALTNMSDFALTDAQLEVTCHSPAGASAPLSRADDLPDVLDDSDFSHFRRATSAVGRLNRHMDIDDRGSQPMAMVTLGTLRPGQTVRAEDDLAVLPSCPGKFMLRARILAREISPPRVIEHAFDVTGNKRFASVDEIESMLNDTE